MSRTIDFGTPYTTGGFGRTPGGVHFRPGTVIGDDFQITDVLAEGGMGTIYRAIQRTTGAERAIKVMQPNLLRSERSRERFMQEARLSSSIRSDHVAKVIAAGIDARSDMPWLAMELLEGMDLATRLDEVKILSLPEVVSITAQIAHALGAAHDSRIIHRDLKPANIFLASSQLVGMPFVVKLLDFGIAKVMVESQNSTMSVGTPAYMAPEQTASYATVSPATDIWALGLVVFRTLVGRCYWRAADEHGFSLAVLWREILLDPMPPASARAADYGFQHRVPRDFDAWFARCVHREAHLRYQDAREAAADLTALVSHRSSSHDIRSSRTADRFGRMPTVPTGEMQIPDQLRAARATSKVMYKDRGERIMVDAEPGMSLLEVSRANSVSHTSVCNGRARCTTCRVLVLSGGDNLSPRTGAENLVAQRKRWPKNIRLACQARVMGNVTVRRLVLDQTHEGVTSTDTSTGQMAVESALLSVLCMKSVGLSDYADAALAYDVAHVVNRLLEAVAQPVEQNGGTMARCSGSELIATFPGDPDEAAASTLRAALRIHARVEVLNQYLIKHFDVPLRVRIGVHHGDVVVGQVGHPLLTGKQIFGSGVSDAEAAASAAMDNEMPILATDSFLAAIGAGVTIGQFIRSDVGNRAGHFIQIVDFETPDIVYLVQSTFERVAAAADEVSLIFYDRLFDQYPEVKPLFAGVDMANQRAMLMQAIASTVNAMHDPDKIRGPLHELGRRHIAYGVKLIHYKAVGECLIWSLEKFFGDDFVPELYIAWKETYGILARMMIEGSMEVSG